MRRFTALLLFVVLLGQGSSGWGQSAAGVEITLQPGDVISIRIWREQELSGEFLVREDGIAVFPLLGERRVVDIPLRELREQLIKEYRAELRNPSITITPLRRVHVLGEVNKPGLYEVDPTVTLAAAVALAGGATGSGDLNRIRVIRGQTVLRERVGVAEALNAADIRSGDQILIDRRSWFERNSTFLISVGLTIPSVIAGVLALVRR